MDMRHSLVVFGLVALSGCSNKSSRAAPIAQTAIYSVIGLPEDLTSSVFDDAITLRLGDVSGGTLDNVSSALRREAAYRTPGGSIVKSSSELTILGDPGGLLTHVLSFRPESSLGNGWQEFIIPQSVAKYIRFNTGLRRTDSGDLSLRFRRDPASTIAGITVCRKAGKNSVNVRFSERIGFAEKGATPDAIRLLDSKSGRGGCGPERRV